MGAGKGKIIFALALTHYQGRSGKAGRLDLSAMHPGEKKDFHADHITGLYDGESLLADSPDHQIILSIIP